MGYWLKGMLRTVALAAALEVEEDFPARGAHGVTPDTKISLTFDGQVPKSTCRAVSLEIR